MKVTHPFFHVTICKDLEMKFDCKNKKKKKKKKETKKKEKKKLTSIVCLSDCVEFFLSGSIP